MSDNLSSPTPTNPRSIGAQVRVSHLLANGARREELEGVVVGREKYGVNVRLPDGTIRGFSDVEVSPLRQAPAFTKTSFD
jgi:hypothetical protein